MRALYVMSPAEIGVAASSEGYQGLDKTIQQNPKYYQGRAGQKSHYEASSQLHRMTGGGKKLPGIDSGPIATALNPERHDMMVHGRPVAVIGLSEQPTRSFQPVFCHFCFVSK